ncbi:MAG: homoserine O-succinyltransferase [Proteobacteria bacterium]|nr:homoserine O-succinyltransferase [Pseudomonadota bacterium]
MVADDTLTEIRTDPPTCVEEGVCRLPAPFRLHHGGVLAGAELGWRLTGPAGAPVVLAIGGISGHRRVSAEDEGWWAPVVGRGRALDTGRVRVLGIDWLGGSGASTAPVTGQPFPTLSAFDQAEAIAAVVAALGLAPLRAVIGASYGGQVALALGARHPSLARQLVVLSAADRTHPMASAWRSVEREMVRFGIRQGDAAGGLKLARALAMCTYRTPREFALRFGGEPERGAERLVLPVESYLFARGDAYVARYRPESFVCLSESIDLFRVDAAAIATPVTAVAVPEDQLVPYADMQALVRRLPAGRLVTLDSVYGHDAFLKEGEALRPIFADCLEDRR